MALQVIDIIGGTSVDGPGLRTSIYFAGCHHGCEGCHNPQSWDPHAGRPMSVKEIVDVVEENGFNVTFSGGDPLYQPLDELTDLARELTARGYRLWCYTGFLYEDIAGKAEFAPLLELLEVMVDGPFVLSQRDISLLFRGSANQRLIDVPASLRAGTAVLWQPYW